MLYTIDTSDIHLSPFLRPMFQSGIAPVLALFYAREPLRARILPSCLYFRLYSFPPSSSFHDPHWIVCCQAGLSQAILPEGDFACVTGAKRCLKRTRITPAHLNLGLHRRPLVIRSSWQKEKRRQSRLLPTRNYSYPSARQTESFCLKSFLSNFDFRAVACVSRLV